MGKLTKPQLELLREANSINGVSCSDTYTPAKALVTRGLAEWLPRKFSSCLRITDAGRLALATESPTHE